ncbi:YbdK family carboxylate-amine ligase [Agromyces sp. MMS24-JH15]|uniref:carboxylate-amine ligase n=1 Tax=Agromyces sp. MMS24-JH15 TaxID=3243765 RepID=UPI0037480E95
MDEFASEAIGVFPTPDPDPFDIARGRVGDPVPFGVEEEFVLLDPDTLHPVASGPAVLARMHAAGFARATSELLASQVESATGICRTGDEAWLELAAFRRSLLAAAAAEGLIPAPTGTPFAALHGPEVSKSPRYQRMSADIGAIVDDHQVCGLHVHVGVDAPEDRVRVLNAMRPWMPLLTALAANSPFWRGADTGFASWRTIVMRRWTTAGVPGAFADAADYDRRIRDLVGLGATRDRAAVAWMMRISHHLPTVELRFGDAQLHPDDAIAIALLCRAIATAILADPRGPVGRHGSVDASMRAAPVEVVSAAVWAAAHEGHSALVPDPIRGGLASVPAVVANLLDAIDAERTCRDALAELLARGAGAERQRAAFARDDVAGLARLYRELGDTMP